MRREVKCALCHEERQHLKRCPICGCGYCTACGHPMVTCPACGGYLRTVVLDFAAVACRKTHAVPASSFIVGD